MRSLTNVHTSGIAKVLLLGVRAAKSIVANDIGHDPKGVIKVKSVQKGQETAYRAT